MNKNNYIGRIIAYCMLIVHLRQCFVLKSFLLIIILTSLNHINVRAANNHISDEDNTPFIFDEIPVRVNVEGYRDFYVDAIYTNNKLLYVNVEELFRMLEIPCVAGSNGNSLSGFIEEESQSYLIDFDLKQLVVGARTIAAKNRLVNESGLLYLETSLFDEAFGLQLNFNFRSLAIQLKSDFELPLIKQSRIEKMRSNLSKIKGETIADTVLKRNYHLFKAGTMDWLLASVHTLNGSTENHFGFGVGTELLYGELCASINYYDQYKFDNRQLQYLWRWVDNDKKLIKQAQVGKISTQTISFLNAPIVGAVVRNTPTTIRKATGSYIISEVTEPNWTVELYINNVLVDYTQADASGQFMFKVPIVYGYTTLKLKFYGTMGEERTEERTMNVPYSVMPAHELEYSLASGMVQDSMNSRFGRGEINYGVNRTLTVGGGMEYLSSISNAPYIPFATATYQPFTKLTFFGEYAYGVKTTGILNYYFRKDILFEIDYTKYAEGQLATRFNAPEERKVKLSVPLKLKKINGFARFDYSQLVYKEFTYNQAYAVFSAYYKQFSANSATQFNWLDQKPAYITSDFALSYRLNSGYTLRSSAQYNLSNNSLMTYKAAIERSIPKGNVSVSYEKNVMVNDHLFSVNLRYDLSFARTNISAIQSKGRVTVSESAMGSMAIGSGNKYIYATNNSTVSKGGISLYPFLDMNQNGIFDADEHMVKINSVKTFGGKVIYSKTDSIVRITDLNAFTYSNVEFKDNDLENIAWKFKMESYQVLVDPNQFKRVDIPVISVGEASGMTYMDKGYGSKGTGRILVNIYRKYDKKLVTTMLSESDGYLYYLGLKPGDYIASVDSAQLGNLGCKAYPGEIPFTIKAMEQGDMVGGIDFTLRPTDVEMPHNLDMIENPEKKLHTACDSILLPFVKPAQSAKAKEIEPQRVEPKVSTPMPDTITNKLIPVEYAEDNNPQFAAIETTNKVNTDSSSLKAVKENIPLENETQSNAQNMTLPVIVNPSNQEDVATQYAGDNTSGTTIYKIQLFALSAPLKDGNRFARLLAGVPGTNIVETRGDDGMYRYFIGNFNTYEEAKEFKKIVKKYGWSDCFIVWSNTSL